MGILTFFISIVKSVIVPVLYFGGIFTCIPTIFKRAEWGFFLMVALIPQPNIFYKLYDYPLGKNFLDVLFISVLIGIVINKKKFVITHNSILVGLLLLISYLSLWNSSANFSLPAPITTRSALLVQWKSYAVMIFMYFLGLNISKDENQHKILLMIMAVVVLFISIRAFDLLLQESLLPKIVDCGSLRDGWAEFKSFCCFCRFLLLPTSGASCCLIRTNGEDYYS